MRNNTPVKERRIRRRLLCFSLFTLAGAGLEGAYFWPEAKGGADAALQPPGSARGDTR